MDDRPIEHHVLRWLLCLPLLTEIELSDLCQTALPSVRRALRALCDRGWLFERTLTDPAAPDHVFAASSRAFAVLSETRDAAEQALGAVPWWNCSNATVATAIAQARVTRGVNRTLATLAAGIRSERAGAVAWAAAPHRDAASGGHRHAAWGHIAVRWQAGARESAFGIHYDTARTPPLWRERLLAQWRRRLRHGRGDSDAPLLVICETSDDADNWIALYSRTAQRVGYRALPPLLIATFRSVSRPYALEDTIWYSPALRALVSLPEALLWYDTPADGTSLVPPMAVVPSHIDPPHIGHPAAALAAMEHPPHSAGRSRHVAAAALQMDESCQRAAAWLTAQAWLSVADLSRIEDIAEQAASRRLAILSDTGVALVSGDDRWALTPLGVHLAAARRGMLMASQAFRDGTSVVGHPDPPDKAPSHPAGVAECIGAVAVGARRAGLYLADWLTERDWMERFGRHQPRPDGVFVLRDHEGRTVLAGLLEYEHAMRGGDSPEEYKAAPWLEWYREERWAKGFPEPPLLLFVAGREGRSLGRLLLAVSSMPADIPACIGTIDAFIREGLTGAVWHPAGSGALMSALDVAT